MLRSLASTLGRSTRCLSRYERAYWADSANVDVERNSAILRGYEETLNKVLRAGSDFEEAVGSLPNLAAVDTPGEGPGVIHEVIGQPERKTKFSAANLAEKTNLLRTANVGNISGSHTYHFMGDLARLERALCQYALLKLRTAGFKRVIVPEILPRNIVESCGFPTSGERSQVYILGEDGKRCLTGTAEMGLAAYVTQMGPLVADDLPLRLCALSRCYRAERGMDAVKGIYRVHEFSKVEMFVISRAGESWNIFKEIVGIQKDIFSSLGLTFRMMRMAAEELGSPAYAKWDMEAWMPHAGVWGEISSASNCTDYQSFRLGVRQTDGALPHTLNGTALAAPRVIIALLEQAQNENGFVSVPEVLQENMGTDILRLNEQRSSWNQGSHRPLFDAIC